MRRRQCSFIASALCDVRRLSSKLGPSYTCALPTPVPCLHLCPSYTCALPSDSRQQLGGYQQQGGYGQPAPPQQGQQQGGYLQQGGYGSGYPQQQPPVQPGIFAMHHPPAQPAQAASEMMAAQQPTPGSTCATVISEATLVLAKAQKLVPQHG